MGDAPERIWAWCFNKVQHGGWGEWGGYARQNHFHPLDEREAETGAEYIRADIARADLEAAVLAEREACAKVVQAYEAECAKFLSREGITVNAFDALAQAAFLISARKP